VPQLSAGLGVLAADSWAVDDNAVYSAEKPEVFLKAYRDLCEFWKKDIFTHPFWKTLSSGNAPRKLVLGWLVEFYHYIDASNEHMAASVAHCRHDDVEQLWLAKHYTEEWDHNKMFLAGLVGAGLDRHEVLTAAPLASTRALINYITEVAVADTHSYAAMHGIFQTAGDSDEWHKVDVFYEFLLSHYPFGASILKAFRDHAALDAELGHDDLVFEGICKRVGRFTPNRISDILDATRTLVEYFVLFFEGILDYYGAPDALLPRRPIDVRGVISGH
jgi:pyrroloquinoline quinone (PQQ) biosynthesis protein C